MTDTLVDQTPERFVGWRNAVQSVGNPEFPFLAADYSPNRRIPCRGFVEWIAEAFLAGDIQAIAKLFCEIVRANPGMWTGDIDLMGSFGRLPADLREINLSGAICGLKPHQIAALLSAYMLQVTIRGYQDEGVIIEPGRYLMAASVLPWNFEIPVAEECVHNANTFIRRMRKDTPFWKDIPLYKVTDLAVFERQKLDALTSLRAALISLSVSARMHLLDAIRDCQDGVARRSLDNCATSDTCQFGCYVKETSHEIRMSGLVRTDAPLKLFHKWFTKKELQETFTRRSIAYKKSAKHAELFTLASERAAGDLASIIHEKGAFILADDLRRLAGTLLAFYAHEASRLGLWIAGWLFPRVKNVRTKALLAKGIVEMNISDVNRGWGVDADDTR